MANTRETLTSMGEKILDVARTELLVSMPFLRAGLFGLGFAMDLSTRTVGTDGVSIRFNANHLMGTYLERPETLPRMYMHMLLHCLFLHMYHSAQYSDGELWDLCCDIAVESVIDGMGQEPLLRVNSDYREAWYEKLNDAIQVLTAEKLYRYFNDNPIDGYEIEKLKREFLVDDHSFWGRLRDSGGEAAPPESDISPMATNLPLKESEWDKAARHVRVEMEQSGARADTESGRLVRVLRMQEDKHHDFTPFLEKFAIWREEVGTDPDEFDLAYYNYGMLMYGNMPLIEARETREAYRIDELVIALDTSASTARRHIQKFLNRCLDILRTKRRFFSRVNIHIIECDNRVQKDIVIHSLDEMEDYTSAFEVHGGYGTDFRPVFSYIEDLRKRKKLRHLRGLLYFTDGHGIYPKKAVSYEVAFIFLNEEEYDDNGVPEWAIKLYV